MPVKRCLNFDEQQLAVVVCQYCNLDGHVAKTCPMLGLSKPSSGLQLGCPTSEEDNMCTVNASIGDNECSPLRQMLYIQFPALRGIHARRNGDTQKCTTSILDEMLLGNSGDVGANSLAYTGKRKAKASPMAKSTTSRPRVVSNPKFPSDSKPVLVPMVERTTHGGRKTHVSFESFKQAMELLGEPDAGTCLDDLDLNELEISQVPEKEV